MYDKAVYEHLDQDSLFFMFYYYTGSYEQYVHPPSVIDSHMPAFRNTATSIPIPVSITPVI